jgi:hypothetical protein
MIFYPIFANFLGAFLGIVTGNWLFRKFNKAHDKFMQEKLIDLIRRVHHVEFVISKLPNILNNLEAMRAMEKEARDER